MSANQPLSQEAYDRLLEKIREDRRNMQIKRTNRRAWRVYFWFTIQFICIVLMVMALTTLFFTP
jgi:hypothetical protein